MNYRHAFHAGNFADVFKHLILTYVLVHLQRKQTPIRVIDTHAGVGSYDLTSDEATRTGEWREGIGRLIAARQIPEPGTQAILKDDPVVSAYATAVASVDANRQLADVGLKSYPGSPALARSLLRPDDMLIANELHPLDVQALRKYFARDPQVRILNLDGWLVPKSTLPPRERRGVILIDPPFEVAGELDRLARAVRDGIKRFATGIYLLWYPIKDPVSLIEFKARIAEHTAGETLAIEIFIRAPDTPEKLNGCGLIIHNPPYGLTSWIEKVGPSLTDVLRQGTGASWRIEQLDGNRSAA